MKWNIFNKRIDKNETLKSIEREKKIRMRTIKELNFDCESRKYEREQIIKNGVTAYEQGDRELEEELADDLEIIDNEIKILSQQKRIKRKEHFLFRKQAMLLKHSPSCTKQTLDLLEDPKIQEMLHVAEDNFDSFKETVEKRYHLENTKLKSERQIERQKYGESPFKAISEAIKTGDLDEVTRAKENYNRKFENDNELYS